MQPLSESQEDYLKSIFQLSENSTRLVSAMELADRMDVKPASVTSMLKKLAKLSLIDYTPYQGVALTPSGKLVALEVLRHHRLIELFLTEFLDFGWEEVHEQAEKLEHVISEELEARMAEKLGHPTHDPHGDPIPTVDLELPESPLLANLLRTAENHTGVIKRVTSQDRDFLNLLNRLELNIGVELRVISQERGGVRIQTATDQFLIPVDMASKIWMEAE